VYEDGVIGIYSTKATLDFGDEFQFKDVSDIFHVFESKEWKGKHIRRLLLMNKISSFIIIS